MNDVKPDFRAYAQASAAYTSASVFGRDKVFSDEIASLEKRFGALDVHSIYVVRLSAPLQQYDSTSQSYGVDFGESAYIPFTDPVTYVRYGVQFMNRSVITKIPMTPDAAEAYARRFNLPISGSYVGNALLQMAFRIDTVPPPVSSSATMLDATIVAARLYTTDGRLMHDFPVIAAPPTSPASVSDILKARDIEGLKLSMPIDAAISAGKVGWTKQLGSPNEGVILFFNGLEQRTPPPATINGLPNPFAAEWAVCAGQQSGRQNSDERGEGMGPPSFKDCIAIVETGGKITRISSQQHLSNVDPTSLKAQLDAKYGTPVQISDEGNGRIWIGHDPTDPNGREMMIQSTINTFMTPEVLTITSSYYDRPGTKAPSPSVGIAPKL